MPAPICVQCQMTMRCEKNDRLVNDVRAGNFPPTYWLGDMFRCQKCHTEIVVGFGIEMDDVTVADLRAYRALSGDSMCFAYSPEQREQYADQFEKRSKPDDKVTPYE